MIPRWLLKVGSWLAGLAVLGLALRWAWDFFVGAPKRAAETTRGMRQEIEAGLEGVQAAAEESARLRDMEARLVQDLEVLEARGTARREEIEDLDRRLAEIEERRRRNRERILGTPADSLGELLEARP